MKKQDKEYKPVQINSYESLFITKETPYEDLFLGGSIEELSSETPYSFIHPNKDEVEELLEKSRKIEK
jgi:intein-encoded DNA endonuclease-like protein